MVTDRIAAFPRRGGARPQVFLRSGIWLYVWSLPLALFLISPFPILIFYLLRIPLWEETGSALVRQAFQLTLQTSLATVLAALVMGTPLAYLLARQRFPGKTLVEGLVELPIVVPPIAAGVLLLLVFGRQGALGPLLERMGISLPFTPAGVVTAQLFISVPFYIRGARLGFMMVPKELEEAAAVDGASSIRIWQHVRLPLAFPGMFSGLILCWARAVGEFGATYLFAGNMPGRTQTMPLAILSAMESDLGAALLLTGILTALAFATLLSAWLLVGGRGESSLAL
jgi:molybdate transport system permease protein